MGRRSKSSEAQIIAAIREVEAGAGVGEVARKVGVSLQTLARWREKYSGMTVPEAKEKRRLPDVPRLIDRLVERALIERARATDDRRVVRLRLTPAGKKLVEEVHEPLLASNRALFRHMSESELVTLAEGLARALAGPLSSGRELDDAGSKPPPSSEVERVDEKKRLAPRRRRGR